MMWQIVSENHINRSIYLQGNRQGNKHIILYLLKIYFINDKFCLKNPIGENTTAKNVLQSVRGKGMNWFTKRYPHEPT